MKTDSKLFNLGQHLLAEFYECNSNILNNVEYIEQVMTEAAVECGATVIQKNFHMFSPYGVSGVVIISESHLAIHTWPEFGYAAVDLFTCGDSCDPKVAYAYLQEKLGASSAFYSELKRGLMHQESSTLNAGDVIKAPFIVAEEAETEVAFDSHNGKTLVTSNVKPTRSDLGVVEFLHPHHFGHEALGNAGGQQQ